jgi:hypothetical protein
MAIVPDPTFRIPVPAAAKFPVIVSLWNREKGAGALTNGPVRSGLGEPPPAAVSTMPPPATASDSGELDREVRARISSAMDNPAKRRIPDGCMEASVLRMEFDTEYRDSPGLSRLFR